MKSSTTVGLWNWECHSQSIIIVLLLLFPWLILSFWFITVVWWYYCCQGNYLWLKASPCFPTLNTTNKGPANEWTQRQTRVLLGNVQYIITVQMKQKTALIVIGHVNYGDDDSHCLLSPGKGLGRARWAMPAMPSQKNGRSSKGTSLQTII